MGGHLRVLRPVDLAESVSTGAREALGAYAMHAEDAVGAVADA
jgi:hypothetical protein